MSMPSWPVQALAMPELAITTCTGFPPLTTSLSQSTGAAFTTLLVKVPAVMQSFCEKIIAMSVLPLYLMPASAAAAINPFAASTPP